MKIVPDKGLAFFTFKYIGKIETFKHALVCAQVLEDRLAKLALNIALMQVYTPLKKCSFKKSHFRRRVTLATYWIEWVSD